VNTIGTKLPTFEVAYREAGGDEPQLVDLILSAAISVESALSRVHHYKKSRKLTDAVERLGKDTFQLLRNYPEVQKRILSNENIE